MKVEIRTRQIKNGCQTIYLDFYDSGKRWYEYLNLHLVPETDADSKRRNADAMAKAVEIKAKRVLGIEEEEEEPDNPNDEVPRRVFADWMDAYQTRLKQNPHYSASYCRNVQSLINIVKAYLKHRRRPRVLMKKIDKAFVKGFLDFIQNTYCNAKSPDNPKPLSPRTLHLHQTTLSTMLDAAVKDGSLLHNPFRALEQKERIQKVSAERDFLTKEEVNAMATAPSVNEMVRQAFLFCCFTGLRYSDVSTLTWRDIKQTSLGPVISLRAMRKTGHSLTVPLNQSAQSWLPKRDKQPINQRVFDGLVTLGQCNKVLKKMAAAAGITKNVSFHTSRHAFATLALAAGGDLYTVGKLLGHRSIESTQIYADVMMDTKIEAISKVSDYFSAENMG